MLLRRLLACRRLRLDCRSEQVGAGSLPTEPTLIPDLPPQAESAHRFFFPCPCSCLGLAFFAGSLCHQRLCRFHPRVYEDTQLVVCARFFFGSRLVNVGKQLPVSPQSHFLVKIESSFIDSQVHYLILLLSYMEVKHHGQVMRVPISKKTKFNSIG